LSQKGPECNQGTKDALPAIDLVLGATEQSLGDQLTKSLHVLVDRGHLWPLAEQVLESTARSTAKRAADQKRQRMESSWAYQYKYIYLYKDKLFP
jgi:hypothetical protein